LSTNLKFSELQYSHNLRLVGSGGHGIVYQTTVDDKVVALKVLEPNKSEEQKNRFRQEIALMR
jgi:hypothetical protein